jgi:chemotaxis protein methyltransferase CheR
MALSLEQDATVDFTAVTASEGRNRKEIEDIEFSNLLEGIYQRYGFDLRELEASFLRRRIRELLQRENLPSISALQEKILRQPKTVDALMSNLCSFETGLFRDPEFYLALRQRCIPLLKTYPSIRIWVVGCSEGDEVYSIAMLLREEGLSDKSKIYATDIHQSAWELTQERLMDDVEFDSTRARYQQSGGNADFGRYFTSRSDLKRLDASLLENVVFGQHNLITDQSFNEFHLILCRNHLIHFKRSLHHRAVQVLRDSLVVLGFLGIGEKETLKWSQQEKCFDPLQPNLKLYRRTL